MLLVREGRKACLEKNVWAHFFSKMEKTLDTKVLWYKSQGRNYGRNNGKWLQWKRTISILGEFRKRKRRKKRRKRKWDVTRKLFLNLGMITSPITGNIPVTPRVYLSLMVVADGVSFPQHLLSSLCASLEDEESDTYDAEVESAHLWKL